MAFIDVAAVEARCDTCGQTGVDDEDARWFASRDAAQEILAGYGWMFTNAGIACESCVQAAACELVGHDWEPWVYRAFDWYVGRTRTCSACRAMDADPPLPAHARGGTR